MNTYIQSFLLFAVPANSIVGAIMLIGRRQKMRWSIAEYLFVYLTWGVLLTVAHFLFGGLDLAMGELGISEAVAIFLSVAAGVFGGLSFLPRIFTEKYHVNGLLVTSISSFLLAIAYVKVVAIMFLLIPPVSLT